jgi:hypothetical protein
MKRSRKLIIFVALLAGAAALTWLLWRTLDLGVAEKTIAPRDASTGFDAPSPEDDNKNEAAYLEKLRELRASGDVHKVCDFVKETVTAHKEVSEAWVVHGFCALEAGLPKAAINSFNMAKTRGLDDTASVTIGMAESFRRLGKMSIAVKYYGIYAFEHPDGPDIEEAKAWSKKLTDFDASGESDPCGKGLCSPDTMSFFK